MNMTKITILVCIEIIKPTNQPTNNNKKAMITTLTALKLSHTDHSDNYFRATKCIRKDGHKEEEKDRERDGIGCER